MKPSSETGGLTKYLSVIQVWALSIGCAVGWGSFVMPGTTFLPIAGPAGTAAGIAAGAVIMFIIGVNYHFLMNKYPDAGGTLTYSIRAFGFDHGLLSAWFLLLVYIAISWANATAIVLIVRNLFGGMMQWGFHYRVAGYDVYCGEVVLTLAVIILFGSICVKSRHISIIIQTVMAFILVGGVAVCAFFVLIKNGGTERLAPLFSDSNKSALGQISGIVVLAPWAFAGFESISNSTQEFRFSTKKSLGIMIASLCFGTACYILLALTAASALPEGFGSRAEYIAELDDQSGYAAIPTFYAINEAMGRPGLVILGISVTAGIITGIIGNFIAASRLIYSMTENNILPEWFGRLNKNGNPANAFKFLILISLFVPFAGRAAIGWIVDVNTIGALIAYAYTSAAAFKTAAAENKPLYKVTGVIGVLMSAVFFVYFMIPNIWTVSNLSMPSYLILIVWSVFGFLLFRMVFGKDKHDRFGKSTGIWIAFLFLIFFASMLWMREATKIITEQVLNELSRYNSEELAQHGVILSESDEADAVYYLQQKMNEVSRAMIRNGWIQMTVIVIALLIMLSIYKAMTQREKRIEAQKVRAEETSRAKSNFLSNMSHDIRTPMNAILGYTNLARKEKDPEKAAEYLEKIEASGQHLLALINDILDMSCIENGKMVIEPARADLKAVMDNVRDLFSVQMISKSIRYTVNTDKTVNRYVMCDVPNLNRVLLNLISNAYKFTPQGGAVTVSLRQTGSDGTRASYEISVKDTGMGMSPEFAETVFEAYSREKTVASIQGTGLGMAITKSIVEMMGGTVKVNTEQGKGTEFIIRLEFDIAEEIAEENTDAVSEDADVQSDFSGVRLLLVDDNEINREIAAAILDEFGFVVDCAENGRIAYETIAASSPGEYKAVLMDIQMPVMNGYEAARAIRSLENKGLADIPVIAMTANAFAEDIRAAKEAGMNAHIAKPIDVAVLMDELTKVLQ